ncbi:hypothetical protein ONE63_001195 [Megalurothrips usitatus]|uniref:Kazal-like domain-containing protein n=1 Tax=Megalurothrips usitatus TaxID=439358 RepID=A0AAV7XFJ3_9NEOP|nr:hypothetical protein ONE63_001195 [Megalurothrips usitatus]
MSTTRRPAALLVILAASLTVATCGDQPSCPQVCSFLFDPLCAAEYRVFATECDMHRYNCDNGQNFQFVKNGPCTTLGPP